ncbi:MAG TPA: hypothetical protein DCE42_30080 [Myxococcales bacterium]|nr:hypothetical protein [Deltaproteobacteria bacterium]HAA59041.1 hypothetical protein [Myxococcales bacterium]|tara:strand:+ start:2909 stop:4165 length:1257 start_codon:yes stop_codon:yes gene_type:complete
MKRMMALVTGVCLLLLPLVAHARSSMKLRGYAESRYSLMAGLDLGSLCEGDLSDNVKSFCDPHIVVNRIRPSALFKFSRKLRLRAEANLLTTHFRLQREVTDITDILTLARLYLDIRTKYVDIRIGQQAFNWGPAQLWSLTTPFVPQDPTDLNAELPGLWAVSAQIGYSMVGYVKLGVMAAPDFTHTLEFIRWKHTFGETDVALTVVEGGAKRRVSIGAEVKGTLGVGYWVEAALNIPYEQMADDDTVEPNVVVVVGMDYSFPILENMIITLQYYFNSAGITDKEKYPFNTPEGLAAFATQLQQTKQSNNVTGIGFSSGGFLGAHYLFLSINQRIFEELSVSIMNVTNLLDPSFMVGAFVNWNFLVDFSLTVGSYFFLGGEKSEFAPGKIEIPIPNAPEGGVSLVPTAVAFAWIRYNF